MSIADADAKAAMPASDTAPAVGVKLKATMSQPIRKGVAKWTDTVRKMAVAEEVEVLETQVNPENNQIRVRVADGWVSLTDTFGEPLLEPC